MSTLSQWAARWGKAIPPEALADLHARMGLAGEQYTASAKRPNEAASESYVQSLVRLEAPKAGVILFRNNVGALPDETGRVVRYGLANDSKEMNAQIKSADLVGLRRVLIGPQHVGHTIGQFVSREVKHGAWRFNPKDKHEAAQMKWLELVTSWGGDAAFASGVGTL